MPLTYIWGRQVTVSLQTRWRSHAALLLTARAVRLRARTARLRARLFTFVMCRGASVSQYLQYDINVLQTAPHLICCCVLSVCLSSAII